MFCEESVTFRQIDDGGEELQWKPSLSEALAAVRVNSLRLRRMLEGFVGTIHAAQTEGDVSGNRPNLLLARTDAKNCFKVGEVRCLPFADDGIDDEAIDIISILDLLVHAVDIARVGHNSEQVRPGPSLYLVTGALEPEDSGKLVGKHLAERIGRHKRDSGGSKSLPLLGRKPPVLGAQDGLEVESNQGFPGGFVNRTALGGGQVHG